MDNFIRLDYKFDVDLLKQEVYNLVNTVSWGEINQINLTHPKDNEGWFVGVGALIANKNFTVFNSFLSGQYIEEVYNTLCKDYAIGRVRLMSLPAGKCYSYHSDVSKRIHIPIETNEQCMMVIDNELKHMPADGSAWMTNTTKPHTAFNSNVSFERIHILFDLL